MNINNKKVLTEMANSIRALSIDAIENANSGHPGMPMGMADIATILFSFFLKFDPINQNGLIGIDLSYLQDTVLCFCMHYRIYLDIKIVISIK